MQRKPHNLVVRLAQVLTCCVLINVHGRADVGMPHKFLLHANRRAYRVNPHAIRMPERVRAHVPQPRRFACAVQLPPYARVGVRQSADFQRAWWVVGSYSGGATTEHGFLITMASGQH